MSQNLPPQMEGQETPNPIELFWEKNRRWVLAGFGLLVAFIAVYYVLTYMERKKLDREMSLAVEGTNLDAAYENPSVPELNAQSLNYIAGNLISQLSEDLAKASDGDMEKALAELAGTPRLEPALWATARAYFEKAVHAEAGAERDSYFDKAKKTVERLQSEFPKSQWVVETSYPVQRRARLPEDKDNPPKPGDEPELEEPVAGSAAGRLLAQIADQSTFYQSRSDLFEPTYPPEGSPEVVLEFEGYGKVTLAMYEGAMSEHVHAFLDLVHEGFYDGQRIYEVSRGSEQMKMFGFAQPEEVKLGVPSTREDDRTKWDTTARLEEADLLELEASPDTKALSHFPGALTAFDQGGKASKQRYSLLATDGAGRMDGRRAMIGIAKDEASLDIIRDMAQTPFSTEEEQDAGSGKPNTNITIISAIVSVPGGWTPPIPKDDDDKDGGKEEDGEKDGGGEEPDKNK